MSRIGIYAGSFNPVHSGHIAFALQAIESANLDKVYFLPERRPTHKQVEHFAHRSSMIRQAIKPHPKFNIVELVDITFTVERTLPKLRTLFAGDKLVFLMGADTVERLPSWPKADRLLRSAEIVVGSMQGQDKSKLVDEMSSWPVQARKTFVIDAYAPEVSSSQVREALRSNRAERGILSSVARYSNKNWLYVSLT